MSPGEVHFQYLRDLDSYNHEKPYVLEDSDNRITTNVEKDHHPVHLTDIRGREAEFGYESHSFRFIKHATAIDFLNANEQDSVGYIEETMTILQQQFGSELNVCYDVRVSIPSSIRIYTVS